MREEAKASLGGEEEGLCSSRCSQRHQHAAVEEEQLAEEEQRNQQLK
jgi:hypothetical protein